MRRLMDLGVFSNVGPLSGIQFFCFLLGGSVIHTGILIYLYVSLYIYIYILCGYQIEKIDMHVLGGGYEVP